MINRIRNLYKSLYLKRLVKRGLLIGENFTMEKGVNIDANFPWLNEIGHNVILSPWDYILSHDAAGKNHSGVSKIGKVKIGNNVFVGAKSTILPGVTIGDGAIIGTNSVVTSNIPSNSVAVGIPAKVISTTEDYVKKYKIESNRVPFYTREYTLWGGIKEEQKKQKIGSGPDIS